MRLLALVIVIIGSWVLGVGILGLYTTITGWEIVGRSGAMLGLQPEHWRGHWLGTSVAYIALGLTFVCFALGLWRRSPSAAIAWCITVSALSAVWIALFVIQPLPYGFQQIPLGEVAFLIALSVLSWVVVRRQRYTKAI
jgi:hypothetical protein